jgi:stress-induced morphogen
MTDFQDFSRKRHIMTMEMTIRAKLQQAFSPSFLEIQNDSAQHAGHNALARTHGETHFTLTIVAEAFSELSRIKRHQLIYTTLKEEMAYKNGIHALVIRAFSPEETVGNLNV